MEKTVVTGGAEAEDGVDSGATGRNGTAGGGLHVVVDLAVRAREV